MATIPPVSAVRSEVTPVDHRAKNARAVLSLTCKAYGMVRILSRDWLKAVPSSGRRQEDRDLLSYMLR